MNGAGTDTDPTNRQELDARGGVVVLHAVWTDDRLCLWAEIAGSSDAASAGCADGLASDRPSNRHPFALDAERLRSLLGSFPSRVSTHGPRSEAEDVGSIRLRLPAFADPDGRHRPFPSPHLAHAAGRLAFEADDSDLGATLETYEVPCVRVAPRHAAEVLERIEDEADRLDAMQPELEGATSSDTAEAVTASSFRVVAGESVRFFAESARFVRYLLAQQRFVPMLVHEAAGAPTGAGSSVGGPLRGAWQLWLADDPTVARLSAITASMPASARSVVDARTHDGWAMLESFLNTLCDASVRSTFVRETLVDAIDGRDPVADPHVAWLSGLLSERSEIETAAKIRADLVKGARRWIGALDERGGGAPWRLLVRLGEPLDLTGISDTGVPGDSVRWTLTLALQSTSRPDIRVDAADIWVLPGGGTGSAVIEGERVEAPGEMLLSELGRASRLYKKLESTLNDPEPTELELSTADAYRFLREVKPILEEQGFGVEAPAWWDQPTLRLGARMIVQSDDVDLSEWSSRPGHLMPGSESNGGSGGVAQIGLNTLVDYRWQIAVGDVSLTLEQFERLAAQHAPLVRVNGRWVEIRPEDVRAAVRFIRENPGGRMEIGRALRLAYASDPEQTGVTILGMESTGWVNAVFGDSSKNFKLPVLESPRGFVGTLRPYQLKGLSWLAFLDRFGLGACLADDMGLGKTVQLLALLAHERAVLRDTAASDAASDGELRAPPTLLIVPMSVVPNWLHEAQRFTPDLRVLVHHGPMRLNGQRLLDAALASDMVVTTYALAHRDREDLSRVPWARIVLDEAQNIKNPTAKQTRAIREIEAPRKIALTGTPVENRLGELWSIMDFLNGGYLGSNAEFRKRFSLPIERYHDRHRSQQLRGLVQPFILRRLKSDPSVISDLPEKVESKEFCYLTPEQAQLYQSCVNDMLSAADRAEGIQRRGLVLAGLIRLKQICNHPAQFLRESADQSDAPIGEQDRVMPQIGRSGKCQRLIEMLEEVVSSGDKALVFTQFRQMGTLLASMLRRALDREVLFLHGGTPAHERQRMIEEFQGKLSGRPGAENARSGPPVFILSLKAGGVGLNLTAASHVFHFDRWWNPAVEAQATDRAYRIGQTRSVQVHKFVVAGTLEERIDEMIEAKTELANEIIGSGEDWLTELSTTQLRDLLTLRSDAVTEGAEA